MDKNSILAQALQVLNRGKQGFLNPQAPSGNKMQRTLDQVPLLRNIRGFNEGAFGQQAVNDPQVAVEGEMGLVRPGLNAVMAKGLSRGIAKDSPKFNAMHPEDIADATKAIENYHFNSGDLNYYMKQGVQDEAVIRRLAEHYIGKDLIKKYKNDTPNIAQELLNRVRYDQKKEPLTLR